MTAARKSARDQDCTLQFPGCRNDTETVVLCHLREFMGGGAGLKPPDLEAVYGCQHCHDLLDMRKFDGGFCDHEKPSYILWALIRTHRIMHAMGIIKMKGEK